MILGTLGLDIGPAVAGLGVVGIAVGFGAQSLVRDFFNGALILIENQFSVGDVVRLAGVDGTVEDFTLRRTTVRDLDGIVHTIPNSEIRVASNLTRVWARINQDVTVAHGTDIERAIEVVDAVGQEMAADPVWRSRILEPPRVDRVEAISEQGVTLKILGSVRAPEQWAAASEYRKLLLAALDANGIDTPGRVRPAEPEPSAPIGSR
jgi:small conductance mechanosensitive channel